MEVGPDEHCYPIMRFLCSTILRLIFATSKYEARREDYLFFLVNNLIGQKNVH
jgi:hypothetical protein